MPQQAIIVCEPTGQWAGALRRALGDEPLRLVETRRTVDAWQELVDSPRSVLALAWSAERRAELAEFADRVGRRFPQARVVVLVDRSERREELLAHELGAVHVCSSPRQAVAVVRLARRHLGPQPEAHWPAMDDAIDEIWQRLPWNLASEERIG
jgi:DNA-binding NarL/FixJ family response regulator